YAFIAGKGIISAFSTSGNLINGDVATVVKGKPAGIASFGGNVFVANSTTNSINEYTRFGGMPVFSISDGVQHPVDVVALGGDLFVLNQGGKIGEYITEYNGLTGQRIDGIVIQGLHGKTQFA